MIQTGNRRSRLWLAAALLLPTLAGVAACGVSTSTSSTSAAASTAAASNAQGWSVKASVTGPSLEVTATVIGPAEVYGGCEPTLKLSLTAADGSAVPTTAPGIHCMAITLITIPAGQHRDFTASLPSPPSGTYTVHTKINQPTGADPGSLPDVRVQI